MARPKKITKAVLQKLEEGFMKGLSDREACLYVGISAQTLYNYCKEHPEFLERKELLKEQLKMRAKLTLAQKIEKGNLGMTMWYLERKAKDEFSLKQEIEHSGGVENRLDLSGLSVEELRKLANPNS